MNHSATAPKTRRSPTGRPSSIGGYAIEHVLGQGGMGIVYAARHIETGTRAAVKTAMSANSAMVAQLRREIFTLARLRHPGVVRILDHGISGGMPWYAMELIEGATLNDLFDKWWDACRGAALDAPLSSRSQTVRDLPPQLMSDVGAEFQVQATRPCRFDDQSPPETQDSSVPEERCRAAGGNLSAALGLIRDVCDVLSYLHGEGVIHRDLKPANVFVRDNGQPVLVDFGLADELGGRAGREVMGPTDGVMGSFPYMSPEQLLGEVLDARCDLYAVGCLLYTAVTGRPPFIGSGSEIVRAHLHDFPRPASTWVSDVSEDLDQLIGALLVKQSRLRVGYAEDVASALDRMGCQARMWKSNLPPHRPYLYRPPFVGRRELFDQLVKRLRGVVAALGGVVFIGGESGVGKTRLALEAATCAKAGGIHVVTGTCANLTAGVGDQTVQDQPLRPLGALLAAVADRWLEADADERERLLGARAALLAPYSAAVAALPGVDGLAIPPPLPVELAKERLYDSVHETIRAFGEACPVVVVLEDLQWADELTLGLLEYLTRRGLRGLRGVVVGTYRSDECSDRLSELASSPRVERLLVPRMSDEEVAQMAGGMLNDPPEPLVAFLTDRCGGNPFFVTEYLRSALDEEVLVRTADGWVVAANDITISEVYESLPQPAALQQVVELRLGRLRTMTRGVIEAAAVMGRRIDISVLQLATRLDDEQLLDVLDETVRAHVWETDADGAYRFVHDKLRELPLAEIEPGRRRELHAQVADAIERVYAGSDLLRLQRGTIGHHWAAAQQAAKAVPHLLAAGDAARDVHAIGEAIRLYESARLQVELAQQGGDEPNLRAISLSLHEKLGDVLCFAGQHDQARQAFENALAGAHGAEVALRVRMHRKIAKAWEVQHDHNRAKETYDIALAILPGEPGTLDPELDHEWVQIVLGRAWIFYWLGCPAEMSVEIARVAPHAEARGTHLQRYQYYLAVVTRDYRQYRYRVSEPTLDAGRACVAAAKAAGALPEIAFGRFVLGFALLFQGQLAEAETEVAAALRMCRQLGDAVGETRTGAYVTLLHRLHGRVAETAEAARATLALAEARQMGDYIGMAQACLAWVALREGAYSEAERLSRAARDTWNALSFPFPFRWCGALILVKLLLMRQNAASTEEALGLIQELVAETQHQLPDALDAFLLAAIRARHEQDFAAVIKHLKQALDCAEKLGFI